MRGGGHEGGSGAGTDTGRRGRRRQRGRRRREVAVKGEERGEGALTAAATPTTPSSPPPTAAKELHLPVSSPLSVPSSSSLSSSAFRSARRVASTSMPESRSRLRWRSEGGGVREVGGGRERPTATLMRHCEAESSGWRGKGGQHRWSRRRREGRGKGMRGGKGAPPWTTAGPLPLLIQRLLPSSSLVLLLVLPEHHSTPAVGDSTALRSRGVQGNALPFPSSSLAALSLVTSTLCSPLSGEVCLVEVFHLSRLFC